MTGQVVGGVLNIIVKRAPSAKAPSVEPTPPKQEGAYASVPAMPAVRPASGAPVSKRTHGIDELLEEMMGKQASDLHLTSGSSPAMRVHGEMHFARERPVLTSDAILGLIGPIFTEKARKDFDEKHDADFAYEVPGLARFRVNVFIDRNGVGAVLRQIPIEIITADKLGLPQAVLDLCFLTKGLVVVTGPTGSGKSTTLAAMIDFINKNRNDHIITIEDPIEFVHKNIKCLVNQREVGQHTKSFKNALRAALREDPDIVLVGEMRDLETIAIAIETAETGHLVFGTLHTTTAISTVDRIIDQFPTDQQEQIRVMLSESLKGVVAQVLCKKIGGGRVAAMEILLGNTARGEPHPRRQDVPDPEHHADLARSGHGDDERLAPRARSEEARRAEGGVDEVGRQVEPRRDVQERRDTAPANLIRSVRRPRVHRHRRADVHELHVEHERPFRSAGALRTIRIAVGELTGIQKRIFSPSFISCSPSVQPLMTWLSGNVAGWPRMTELSNIFPSGRPARCSSR